MSTPFSIRYGYKPVRDVIQREAIDDHLRNSLWNVLDERVFAGISSGYPARTQTRPDWAAELIRAIWLDYFEEPLDQMPGTWGPPKGMLNGGVREHLRMYFFDSWWNEVLDFLQFVAERLPTPRPFTEAVNERLERRVSAYRFVGTDILELTSDEQIRSIEAALEDGPPTAADHLSRAVTKLADRDSPDYRNVVKESILAVESACQVIVGDRSATLGAALKIIESRGVCLHGAFRDALEKLYGYTSDADGIRHALSSEGDSLELEDAMFMLVSSSAFVSYLLAKAERSRIELEGLT